MVAQIDEVKRLREGMQLAVDGMLLGKTPQELHSAVRFSDQRAVRARLHRHIKWQTNDRGLCYWYGVIDGCEGAIQQTVDGIGFCEHCAEVYRRRRESEEDRD